MNCPRVEQLLPLYSSDDLPEPQMNAVRAHLANCASCQQLAAEFAESRSWLQGCAPPPFDEAFLADLRVAVRRELATDNVPLGLLSFAELPWRWLTLRWRPVLAFAGVLLLLLGGPMFLRNFNDRKGATQPDSAQHHKVQKQSDSQTQMIAEQNSQLGSTLTHKQVGRKARLAKSSDKQREWRRLVAAPTPQHQASAPNRVAQAAVGAEIKLANDRVTALPEMLRIELQTADPNIRIIWFAPKTGASGSTK